MPIEPTIPVTARRTIRVRHGISSAGIHRRLEIRRDGFVAGRLSGGAYAGRGVLAGASAGRLDMASAVRPTLPAMKKVLVLLVVLALAAFAVKKLQDA